MLQYSDLDIMHTKFNLSQTKISKGDNINTELYKQQIQTAVDMLHQDCEKNNSHILSLFTQPW